MQNRKSKVLYMLISLFVFILGMYCVELNGNSNSCVPTKPTTSYVSIGTGVITDTQACTTEMLGICRSMEFKESTIRSFSQKRDTKISLDFLCQNIFSLNKGKSYINFEKVQFISNNQDKLVAIYLHKSDGKKRSE